MTPPPPQVLLTAQLPREPLTKDRHIRAVEPCKAVAADGPFGKDLKLTNQPTTLSGPATQWLPLDLTKGFFQDSVQNDDTVLKVSLGLSISEEENQDYWTDGRCA